MALAKFTDSTHIDTATSLDGAMPVGAIHLSARSSAPSGYLLCDGSAVNRTTYALLFAAIGTAFGTGNGTTTFNVPDCRGRAPIGVGTGSGLTPRALSDNGGEEYHILNTSEIPSHQHGNQSGFGNFINTTSSASVANGSDQTVPVSSSFNASTDFAGSGGSHNNMQPFIALNYFIFAGA